MKKFLSALLCGMFLLTPPAFAVDTEAQDLADITSPVTGDDMYIVDNPDVAPASRKISIGALFAVSPDMDSAGNVTVTEADVSDLAHTATAITDDLIINADLNIDVEAEDTDYLQYDSTGDNFTWRSVSEVLSDIGAESATSNDIDPDRLNGDAGDDNLLAHEIGGLEADVSAYSGLVKISGGATSAVTDSSTNWDTAYTHSQDNSQAHTDYSLHAGDIYTGTHDYGGADDLEIPNSATPTVDTAGQMALDTTITSHDGLIIYYQGAEAMVLPAIPLADLTTTDGHVIDYNSSGSKFTMGAPAVGGETNSLETTITGIADTELVIGNGADSAVYAAMTGDGSLSNAGAFDITEAVLIDGGTDPIDGDKLEITATWDNITPDTGIAEADSADDLAAILEGIDDAIGAATGDMTKAVYDTDDDTYVDVSENVYLNVYNSTGATINDFNAVYITGWNVGTSEPTVALADADDSAKMPAIGITIGDIANNASGAVIISGDLGTFDTSGSTGPGSAVYVTTTGTNDNTLQFDTWPTGATTAIQKVGTVVRDNVNGRIEVIGAGRSNAVPNIAEAYLWVGNASGVATAVTMSSDASMTADGTVTVADDSHAHVIANIDSMTSEALAGQISDETGSGGGFVRATSPTFTTSIVMGAADLSEAELEILDGATLTTTEINYVDGVTADIQTQLDNATIRTIGITIDGGGSVITTGYKGVIQVPYACTIQRVTMLADQSGTIAVDVLKDTYANYPPVDADDSITASAVPTLTTAIKDQDSTLTGWTTSISADDVLRFYVEATPTSATVTRVHVLLTVTVD